MSSSCSFAKASCSSRWRFIRHLLSIAVLAIFVPEPVAVVVGIVAVVRNSDSGATGLCYGYWTAGFAVGSALVNLGTGSGQTEFDRPEPVWPSGLHGEGGRLPGHPSVAGGWGFASV